jgi:hypothetical protein
MKTGKTIEDLAAEIVRQQETKNDMVVSTSCLAIAVECDGVPMLNIADQEQFPIGATAHQQIASHVEIPKVYYDRMLATEPQLLADNVNTWFRKKPTERMVRLLDGRARAFLSNKYRRIDNGDLFGVTYTTLIEAGMEVVSADITERHMYLKAVNPNIKKHLPHGSKMGEGHTSFRVPNGELCPAVMVRNSEIGYGNGEVVGGYLEGGCTNLAWMFKERGMRKMHIGKALEIGEDMFRWLSDETQKVTDDAIKLQFRDAVKVAITQDGFDDLFNILNEKAGNVIEADPIKVLDVTAKKFALTEAQKAAAIRHLIAGGDLSQYGLAAALTSTANEQDDYDTASSMEGMGGKILELPKSEWKALANARDFGLKAAA